MEYKLGKSLFSHAKIVQTKSYPVLTLNSSMMQKVEMRANLFNYHVKKIKIKNTIEQGNLTNLFKYQKQPT